ncbi:hypothetical protein ABZP36_016361 [Zizania latifolia]
MPSNPSTPPPPAQLNVHSGGYGSNHSGGESQSSSSPGAGLGFSRCTFTYEDLAVATDGFSGAYLLGQGHPKIIHRDIKASNILLDARFEAKARPLMTRDDEHQRMVVRALEGDVSLDDLSEGVRPGHSRFLGSYSSSEYDTGHYKEDMKKFRKMAFGSSGLESSQQTLTSEYGQNLPVSSGDGHQLQEETEMGIAKKGGDESASVKWRRPSIAGGDGDGDCEERRRRRRRWRQPGFMK